MIINGTEIKCNNKIAVIGLMKMDEDYPNINVNEVGFPCGLAKIPNGANYHSPSIGDLYNDDIVLISTDKVIAQIGIPSENGVDTTVLFLNDIDGIIAKLIITK